MESKDGEVIEIYDSDSNEAKIAECSSINNRKRKLECIEIRGSSDDSEDNSDSEDDVQCVNVSDSESEPDVECDDWDRTCRILDISSNSILQGFHLMPTCLPKPEEKQIKLSIELNNELAKEDFVTDLKEAWQNEASIDKETHELIIEPFKLCVIKNLLHETKFLDDICHEFNEIEWNHRNMDLYELFQSPDLKHEDKLKNIKMAYEFLKNDLMKWVAHITGYELTKISATCSFYSDTNYLLVHDDQQDDRMVAYILYLTGKEGWKSEWGGALQMFSRDEHDQPNVPVRNIVPAKNQFVFFPVSNKSYHQVEEVTCKNYCRFSINGWFHVETPPKFDIPSYKSPTTGLYSKNALLPLSFGIDIEEWIDHDYLSADTVQEIQVQIEESSEICLQSYLLQNKYDQVVEALKCEELKWNRFGPPNRRNYEILIEENLPQILQDFLNVFRSREMFALLEGYTELELASKTGTMRYEMQRWSPGSYSLLTDDYEWQAKSELDLVMYLGCESRSDIVGGRTQYIALEDEIQQALITVDPEPNTVNLVFRDTARVTRHDVKKFAVQRSLTSQHGIVKSNFNLLHMVFHTKILLDINKSLKNNLV